jgi:hypothetical protein
MEGWFTINKNMQSFCETPGQSSRSIVANPGREQTQFHLHIISLHGDYHPTSTKPEDVLPVPVKEKMADEQRQYLPRCIRSHQ